MWIDVELLGAVTLQPRIFLRIQAAGVCEVENQPQGGVPGGVAVRTTKRKFGPLRLEAVRQPNP